MNWIQEFTIKMVCLLVVLLTGSISTHAQTGIDLTGRVLNDALGEPWGGVTVTLTGNASSARTVTDGNGAYAFRQIPPGTYALEVCCGANLVLVTKKVVLTDGAVTNVDLATHEFVRVHGRVIVQGGQRDLPEKWYRAAISATSVGAGKRRRISTTVRRDGSFVLSLPQGEYHLDINNPGTYVVKGILWGRRDLLTEPLKIDGPTSPEIEITLTLR